MLKHNYAKTEIIRNKIRNNTATTDDMKDSLFQKIYFIETFLNYPTLSYNEIAICLVNKYNIEEIKFSPSQFSKAKYDIIKKQIFNKTNSERINEIKLFGKDLLFANIKYRDIQTQKDKSFRIFGTDKSIYKPVFY